MIERQEIINNQEEIRIYLVNCNEARKLSQEAAQNISIVSFADISEQLGTVYSLSNFLQKINNKELSDLTNYVVRGVIIYDGLIIKEF